MITVTAIMPVYNEAGDLPDVLASLSAQTFAHDELHLIIVDGGSTDGTRDIAAAWLARGNVPGEIIDNPRRDISASLNLGIANARNGSIIVRLDGHTTYGSGYVQTIVDAFAAAPNTIGCIGGAQNPRPETRFDLALVASLYANPLGLGGASFRRATQPQVVRGVYLGAWRPGVLQEAGGFDPRWIANEDGELAARLGALGYATLFVPLTSEYRVKRGPLVVVRQWGTYGFWRAQTLRKHPAAFHLRHLAPPLALAGGILLLLTPFRALALALYVAYAAGIWALRPRGERPLVTLAACAFFPACQAAWGMGLLRGFAMKPALSRATVSGAEQWRGRLDAARSGSGSRRRQ